MDFAEFATRNKEAEARIAEAKAKGQQSLIDDLSREVSAALAVIPVDDMTAWVVEVRSYLRAWKVALAQSKE